MKFLKTYGKQKTKLSAWITIENRKQAFDSTSASDVDMSTQQASRPTGKRNISNAAKKKAPPQLTSEDEEAQPLSHRGKPSKARLVRARKRKLPSLSMSSDEENVVPSTQKTKATNHKKTRKKQTKVCIDKTTSNKTRLPDQCSDGSMCPPMASQNSSSTGTTREKDSTIGAQTVQECKSLQRDSIVQLPSAGRFVTRRRCAVSSSPRRLNSSDEFSRSQIIRPLRKRCPPVFLESSTDSSVNAAVLRSFVTIPLRDISLNESAEHSLGPCSRKPIFCSTPSAAPLGKRLKFKSFNPTSSPPAISVSCIGPENTFQADLGSPPHAPPSQSFVDRQAVTAELPKQSQSHHEKLCDPAIMGHLKSPHEKTSSSRATHRPREEGSHEMSSVVLIENDVSSYFTSVTGELDWLTDVLKEKCLTQLCTVRLERLDDLIHLFSETTYSSCLTDLGSVCSSNSKNHQLSSNTNHTSHHRESSNPSTSPEMAGSSGIVKPDHNSVSSVQHIVLVSDSQSTEPSKSDDCKESEQKSSLDLFSESANSCTDIADVQVQDGAEELYRIIKNNCLSRECSVELEKLPQSSIVQRLVPEPSQSEHNHFKARPSQRNSSPVCQLSPEEAELAEELKVKCLDSKPLVKVRQMSITEIKHKLRESLDVSQLVSEQTEPESNCTVDDSKDACLGVGPSRKRPSTSSNDKAVSDKDNLKTSYNGHNKKSKKKSMAPKEKKRKTSPHRPGTTRKACVSGLSVSRWKNRDAFTSGMGQRGGTKAADCSINDLIPSQHRQPVELTDFSKNISTPVRGNNLNLSSLLAELTPNTHTWSRLKAALSIHRKVILTPKTPGPQQSSKLALTDISRDLFATPFRTPLPKRLRSQLMTHESQLVFEDDELSDAEKVYAECGQQGPLSWEECLLPQRMKQCIKIGEGTFGEVFSTTSAKCDEETVALKVIPVEGSEKVNGEEQKTFGEILHEIIISKELSCLKEKENNQTSGFIGLRDLHCVKGCYPPEFLNAWDKFDKQKHSENDRPDFFESEQLFIILEFEFGGTDLENCNGTLPSIIAAKSILHQVTAALAVAEQELHFEHRDLHWGNVLVKMTKEKTAEFSLNGTELSLETKGVLVRIIDYSLSRLEIDELTVSCDIAHDEELFMGQGDYQFEIYRLMRQENRNDWSGYNPHSNVLWLHYLCSKLLDMKYRGSGGRRNKDIRGELTSFYDNVLQFSSATEVLQNSPLFQ